MQRKEDHHAHGQHGGYNREAHDVFGAVFVREEVLHLSALYTVLLVVVIHTDP